MVFLKWSHYPEIYDKHFEKYRDQPINILEINYWESSKNKTVNFMSYLKDKIDELNIKRTMRLKNSAVHPWKDVEVRFTQNTNSMTFYDNVVVLEKELKNTPKEIRK